MTTPKIKYRANPRYHGDGIPIYLGSSQDSRLLYDATNDEWTVQTKDTGGTQTDRVRVEANVDITRVELYNDDPGVTGIRLDSWHESASPALNDVLFQLRVYGEDAGSVKTQYGGLRFLIKDATGGSEDGSFELELVKAGALTKLLDYQTGAFAFQEATVVSTTTGALTLSPSGDLVLKNGKNFIGDTANVNMTVGLTINQGANDDHIFTLKSSDLSTGLTTAPGGRDVETDDFFAISKARGASGGVWMQATHGDASGEEVFVIESIGGTGITDKTTAGRGLMDFYVSEHDGSNALDDLTADSVAYAFRARRGGSFVSLLMLDEDGDVFVTTVVDVTGSGNAIAATAFDGEDDLALVRTFELSRQATGIIKSKWDDFVHYNEDDLIRLGILGAPVAEGGMWNLTQHMRLINGALWQLAITQYDAGARLTALEQESRRLKGLIGE